MKINLVVDPAAGRMSILKEQGINVKVYTYSGNYSYDLFTRNIKIIKFLQDIIDDARALENAKKSEKIEMSIYIEKPRIAQYYQGRVVEKGFGYRIHWIISTILTIYSLSPNVEIKKVSLINPNQWYHSLKLHQGGRKMRKQNAIIFAEEIVKEKNIEVKELREDEADAICLWYYVKEICNYEIVGKSETKTKSMNILQKPNKKQQILLKEEVLKWFNE